MADKRIDWDIDEDESLAGPFAETFRPLVTDRMTTLDALAGLVVGSVVVLLHSLLNLSCLNPDEWANFAIATGVRPAESLFSGLWHYGARWIFSSFPLQTAYFIFRTAGYVAAEIIAVLSYFSFRQILAMSIKQYHEKKAWKNIVAPCVSALGAILVSCADGIWFACEDFGPAGLFMVVLSMALALFVHFARYGGKWWLYSSAFFFGLAVGEHTMGLVALVGCVVAYNFALAEARASDMEMAEIHDDDKFSLPMAYVFGFVGFLLVFFASTSVFKQNCGVEYTGWSAQTVPLRFFFNYIWHFAMQSASFLGWMAVLIVAVIPATLTLWYFHLIMDDDREIGIGVILIFSASFAVALMQFTYFDQLWVWTMAKNLLVNFKELKCAFHILTAITVVLSVAAFGMSFCCRSRFVERKVRRFVQGAFVAGVGVIILAVVASRQIPERRAIINIVDEYVNEIACEAEDSTWIFTVGQFDVGVELAAFNQGNRISALSLNDDASAKHRYIRQRFAESDEEKLALRDNAATALKTWKNDFPDNLNRSAIQVGFENWRRGPGEMPPMSGLLGRPGGFSEGVAESGIDTVRKMVKKMKKLLDNHFYDNCIDVKLKEKFTFMLWRIARIARIRATRADTFGDSELAVQETDFADFVSSLNPDYVLVNERMGSVGLRALRHLSPREQLRDALRKADFTMARPYADAILKEDPDNVPANFALAMFYFVEDQYSKSISYFERCIARRPNEPTFYNNIAYAQFLSRQYGKAYENAKRALELKPDSPEIKDTLRRIEKALADGISGAR